MVGIQQHAMSLSCFLGFMQRADVGCMKRVLSGMGVVPIILPMTRTKTMAIGAGMGVAII